MNKCNFVVPIKESQTLNNDFIIKGIAINSTTTRNNVKYVSDELSESAHTLNGKPILKDHDNSIDSIVGRVIAASFNNLSGGVYFEGKIMDKRMQEMVNDGRINSVSIGATFETMEEVEEDNKTVLVPHGIEFVELSLVAVPADPNAGFAKAICEKWYSDKELKEQAKLREEAEILKLQIEAQKLKKEIYNFKLKKSGGFSK